MWTKFSIGAVGSLTGSIDKGRKGRKPEKKIILIVGFFYNYSRI
jgi:hypothetical protein